MTTVLVTGGTGTLGRAAVPLLLGAGYDVRVLSRRAGPELPRGAIACPGNVVTGAGIESAVDGCHVVLHAAYDRRHMRESEQVGTRRVAAAAQRAGARVLYISIVGVDRHRLPYYRAKRAAERSVAESGADWTVLRATQFHELIDEMLGRGVFIRTRHLRFQPVDVRDVAARLVELTGAPPQGLVADFGGPEVASIHDLAEARYAVTGRRTRLLPVPAIGMLADFDAGLHLAPDGRCGTGTWPQWLARRYGSAPAASADNRLT